MPARQFPDWDSFEIAAAASDSPVAFGADLSPASVLGAYRRGIIPFPAPDDHFRTINEFRYEDQVADGTIGLVGRELADREAGGAGGRGDDPYWVAWWSPDPRPVLSVDQVHLGRNLRKQLRRGDERTTANARFRQVAEECRAGREPRWLTDPLLGLSAERIVLPPQPLPARRLAPEASNSAHVSHVTGEADGT